MNIMRMPKRGISLNNMPKKLHAFYGRLKARGWICFCLRTLLGKWALGEQILRESQHSRSLQVRDKNERKWSSFGDEQFNRVYGLHNMDMTEYEAKDYALGFGWLIIYAREERSIGVPLRLGYYWVTSTLKLGSNWIFFLVGSILTPAW